jgi:hypothetical protein
VKERQKRNDATAPDKGFRAVIIRGLEDAGDRLQDWLVKAITTPWGDVSAAYHSTGYPNVWVYMAAPLRLRLAA